MSFPSGQNNIVYIAIGSNLGDKLGNCRNAILSLEESGAAVIESRSDFYLTEPLEYKDQSWFVNAAVKIRTGLDPFKLLNTIKTMERNFGRVNMDLRYGPRILDLDIIFYNDEIMDTPELVVPHPRMQYREFVLRPLCDVSPEIMHPVLNKSIRQLLDEIDLGGPQCIKIRTIQEEPIQKCAKENDSVQEEINDEVFY